jgi:hypothetical protein
MQFGLWTIVVHRVLVPFNRIKVRWGESLNCGHQRACYSSPQMMMIYEYGEPQWNDDTDWRNERNRRKPVPVPLYPPQIPHWVTRARTPAFAARGRRLTAWAMERPWVLAQSGLLFAVTNNIVIVLIITLLVFACHRLFVFGKYSNKGTEFSYRP